MSVFVTSYSQLNKFSKDSQKFINEFQEFVSRNATDVQKAQLDSFKNYWSEGTLHKDQKEKIIQTFQKLKDRKQPVINHLRVANILRFAKHNKAASSVQMDTLTDILVDAVENSSPKEFRYLFKMLEGYTK